MLARCVKVRGKSEKRERLLKPMQMSAVNGREATHGRTVFPPTAEHQAEHRSAT